MTQYYTHKNVLPACFYVWALGPIDGKCLKENVSCFKKDWGRRLGKMGQEALGPRSCKCHKKNVSYFSEDWEGTQIG